MKEPGTIIIEKFVLAWVEAMVGDLCMIIGESKVSNGGMEGLLHEDVYTIGFSLNI